jgi:CheY-like chemotaxis protein
MRRVAEPARSVLVVEDDTDLRELAALVLESSGYQVLLAANGREALRQVEQGLPDLVLLDMKMPVMNGWEFARQLRERFDDRPPIVVMTAAEAAAERAAEIAAEGYLSKPYDITALVATVAAHLQLAT